MNLKKWCSMIAACMLLVMILICPGSGLGEGTQMTEYVIRVCDQYGLPVSGAYVNICTDTTCQPSLTDENGEIHYPGDPQAYHLQVLKVPEGYSFDAAQEVYTGEQPCETVMTITRNAYLIRIVDQNEEAVPGAMVNLCTDTFCTSAQADENGQVLYEVEPEIYHLQIIRVPEGYSFERGREYYTDPRYVEIVLKVNKDA